MIPDWLNESHLSLLPEEYQGLASELGFDTMLKIVQRYQGSNIYFPKLNRALHKIRNDAIVREFDGGNQQKLANKYGLTGRWVYEILEADRKKQGGTPHG